MDWKMNVYDVPGRKVAITEGVGKATPDAVKKMTDYVLSKGKSFNGKWAYIPIIDKLEPILDPETQQLFANMHTVCEEAGCAAFAFVAGGMAAIKVQAKRHQQTSHADKLVTEYFQSKEEALDWLKEEFNI